MLNREQRRGIIGGSTDNPFVIHPYYTGRDKGCVSHKDGTPMLFYTEGDAWWYIFNTHQPHDPRAKHNYRVITLREYQGE